MCSYRQDAFFVLSYLYYSFTQMKTFSDIVIFKFVK